MKGNKMEKKISKVTIEYEDGSAIVVRGEEAKKWKDAADGSAVYAQVHGMDYFSDIQWEEFDNVEDSR